MSTETILTNYQIHAILHDNFLPFSTQTEGFARAVEQAVLQSDQVQAWKKDAERYRWLRDNSSVILDRHAWFKAESGTHIETTMPAQRELDAAIDAARENKS